MPNKQSIRTAAARRATPTRKPGSASRVTGPPPPQRRRWIAPVAVLAALLLVAGLYGIFRSSSAPATTTTGAVDYQVGDPGSGKSAPDFTLPSTDGQPVSLSAYRGKSVLLYFHEGLGCQPCWDQIRDLEKDPAALRDAGVDQLLTITSGPTELIAQKMNDDGLASVALADVDLAVSRTYNANRYGMMGDSRDGHTFILVGPDGDIEWRADYGGAPRYTMYVPVPKIVADLKSGRQTS